MIFITHDDIDKALAQEVAQDLHACRVLKASRSEIASWSNYQRLNYCAGVHPKDAKVNQKVCAIRKAISNHFIAKRGIVFEGKKNLSKYSVDESYFAV